MPETGKERRWEIPVCDRCLRARYVLGAIAEPSCSCLASVSGPSYAVAVMPVEEHEAALAKARKEGREEVWERLQEVGIRLQKWARTKRAEAKKFVGPEKEQATWIAKGYDNAVDLLFDSLTKEGD